MESSSLEGALVLEDLVESNQEKMINCSKKYLDVVITKNSDPVLKAGVDNKVKNLHKSNHPLLKSNSAVTIGSTWTNPILETEISVYSHTQKLSRRVSKLNLFKIHSNHIATAMWILLLIYGTIGYIKFCEDQIPNRKTHRVSLLPWVSNETSNVNKSKQNIQLKK